MTNQKYFQKCFKAMIEHKNFCIKQKNCIICTCFKKLSHIDFPAQFKIFYCLYFPMDFTTVRKTLQKTNLDFDTQTLVFVLDFMKTNIGSQLQSEDQEYHIYASAAIVIENKLLKSMSGSILMNGGLRVETIMRNLPTEENISKQHFLEILQYQMSKYKEAPSTLFSRVERIKLLYRIFKKFRVSFYQLTSRLKTEKPLQKNMMNLLWVIYLIMKLNHEDYFNISVQGNILRTLIGYWFEGTLSEKLPQEVIQQVMNTTFSGLNIVDNNTEIETCSLFHQILIKAYQNRFGKEEKFDIKIFMRDPWKIAMIVYDLAKQHDKILENKSFEYINQLTFLNLEHIKTPILFNENKYINSYSAFSKKIFEEESSSNQDESTNKTGVIQFSNEKMKLLISTLQRPGQINKAVIPQTQSPFKTYQGSKDPTPVTEKLQCYNYFSRCLDGINRDSIMKYKTIIYQYSGKNIEEFDQKISIKLAQIVQTFTTPGVFNKKKRRSMMMDFYIHIVNKFYDAFDQADRYKIFSKPKVLEAILCICIDLYNYTYQFLSEFKKYCSIMEVDMYRVFQILNFMGGKLDMPKALCNRVFQIQKQYLIKDIWENGKGYQILLATRQNTTIPITDLLIYKRLQKHIQFRAVQIARCAGVDIKYAINIDKIIHQIIKNHVQIFQKNKLDSLIVCCVDFFAKQLTTKGHHSLLQTFTSCSRAPYIYQSDKILYDLHGNKMIISDFYNDIFMQEIKKIVQKDHSLLATPTIKEINQKSKKGIFNSPIFFKSIDPIPSKTDPSAYKQKQITEYSDQQKNLLKIQDKCQSKAHSPKNKTHRPHPKSTPESEQNSIDIEINFR